MPNTEHLKHLLNFNHIHAKYKILTPKNFKTQLDLNQITFLHHSLPITEYQYKF